MKRLIRAIFFICFFAVAFNAQALEKSIDHSNEGDGIKSFSQSLMKTLSSYYFDQEDKDRIKVALFDFTDDAGNIIVASRYISDSLRAALGRNSQFEIVPRKKSLENSIVSADLFGKLPALRAGITAELKADVYIFGKIISSEPSQIVWEVNVWGLSKPYEYHERVEPIFTDMPHLYWAPDLTESGYAYFKQVVLGKDKSSTAPVSETINTGDVFFLTQPMSDDLNPWWVARDGIIIYRKGKDSEELSKNLRYGRVMESRVKGQDDFMGLNYVIKSFSLMIKTAGGKATELECYTVPKRSDFYQLAKRNGPNLRFKYLWGDRGRGLQIAPEESGKSWSFFMAEDNWSMKLPVGFHTAVATFKPVAQRLYGSITSKPDYIREFRFRVNPGMNVFVVNYVYHRDDPAIFVRRLDLSEDEGPLRRKIIESVLEDYQEF